MSKQQHDTFLGGFLPGDLSIEDNEFLDGELSEEQTGDPVWVEKAQTDYQPYIKFRSSENMEEVGDGEIDLVITSPPYNVGWGYGSHDDNMSYDEEYLPMLARVFNEVWRVLRPGGRACVNVPTLVRSGSDGGIPLTADIVSMLTGSPADEERESGSGLYLSDHNHEDILDLQRETGFVLREFITWVKGFNTDGLAPNGSFPRPWGVLLNNMHEGLLVFQKPGDRDYDNLSDPVIEDSKINKRDKDMCDDVWEIHPDSWSPEYVDGEDVPVYPEKLVRRCIQLWSYKNDTVLDPFAGRFTVGKVAREEERWSVGYELREELEQDIREYTNMNQMRFF